MLLYDSGWVITCLLFDDIKVEFLFYLILPLGSPYLVYTVRKWLFLRLVRVSVTLKSRGPYCHSECFEGFDSSLHKIENIFNTYMQGFRGTSS